MSGTDILKGKILKSVSRGTLGDRGQIPEKSHAYGGVHGQNLETITFHCEDGDYVFLADGDCCSQTYIDSIEGPTDGLIVAVEEPEWGGPVGEDRDDDNCIQHYRTTLVIEGKGRLDVEYRNESNGYYGGSLELLSKPEKAA